MYTLALMATLSIGQVQLSNVDNLLAEWSGESVTTLTDPAITISRWYTLSLKPGTVQNQGQCWVIFIEQNKEPRKQASTSAKAARGTYEVFGIKKEPDEIGIDLKLTKSYYASLGGQVEWTVDRQFEPATVRLALAAPDRTVPSKKLQLTCESIFFIDDKGTRISKHYEPETLREKITGTTEERKPRGIPAFALGRTLVLREKANIVKTLIDGDDLPPGVIYRSE